MAVGVAVQLEANPPRPDAGFRAETVRRHTSLDLDQRVAAFAPTALEHLAAAGGGHASAKSDGSLSLAFVGSVCR